MSIDRYDPIRVLGEGSFGKVYLMRDKVKRNFVCVKIIKIKNIPKKEREATKLEVDLLKRLHHPNIVGYVDSFLSKNHESLCICMEYCDGGDLASQVKAARRNLFSESKILHWFCQLALGLHYMHNNKVLHRDLKTQNIFLLGNGRLVLGDLGISKVLDGTMDFAQTCIGTPYYMSPEIFKNKPYSYKSDVWALGCVLYEMTTLTHAFDANSLNGLATKIVKGKYPPIHAKYSRYLRELIAQMLMLNPAQRPDLDQILRKPFIKKHIVNFFVDILARPSQNIGEGTMILKGAVGGAVGGSIMNDHNVLALRNQLQQLDMMDQVNEALQPRSNPQDDQEAIRQAKEQASALKREQEHKKMVEAALEKLRLERENRSKQRGADPKPAVPVGRGAAYQPAGAPAAMRLRDPRDDPNSGRRVAAAAPAPVAAAPTPAAAAAARAMAEYNNRRGIEAKDNYVPSQAQQQNAAVRDRGMNWNKRPDENQLPPARYEEPPSAAPNAAAVARRRIVEERAEKERKAASDDRRRQIQEQEAAAKLRSDERRREEMRVEARAREEARLREEARKREEEEREARDKVEQAARARRDSQRDKERERQAREFDQLRRDKIELDRRTQEKDRRREEVRIQEQARLEAERRQQQQQQQMGLVQEKLEFMNNQIQKLEVGPRRGNVAEEKNSEVSARDRVLIRKQEAKAREEAERLDQLRITEEENRRIRQNAQAEFRNKMFADNNAVLPSGRRGVSEARDIEQPKYEFDGVNRQQQRPRNHSEEPSSHLLDEDVNPPPRGRARQDSQPNIGGIAAPQQPHRRASAAADLLNVSTHSDSGSDTDEMFKQHSADNDVEEEEDLYRREEELRAELNFATLRVEELRRTLQSTKEYLGPRLPTRGKDSVGKPPTAKAPLVQGYSAEEFEEVGDDDDEDLYDLEEGDDDYEEDFVDESQVKQAAAGKQGGKGSFSIQSESDDPRLEGADRTLPRLRPPVSAVPSSAFGGLQDQPSPSGKLADRIERLRQKCMEALGRDTFIEAYLFLKKHDQESQGYDNGRDMNEDDFELNKQAGILAILGEKKSRYVTLIDQLIFMETADMN